MSAHTPTPWVYREELRGVYAFSKLGPQDGRARIMIADTSEGQTWNGGELPESECGANGRYIVQCVNERAALVELLDRAQKAIQCSSGYIRLLAPSMVGEEPTMDLRKKALVRFAENECVLADCRAALSTLSPASQPAGRPNAGESEVRAKG